MTQDGVATTYTYDANNRLTAETVAGAVTTYKYDANGNLINAWNSGNLIRIMRLALSITKQP